MKLYEQMEAQEQQQKFVERLMGGRAIFWLSAVVLLGVSIFVEPGLLDKYINLETQSLVLYGIIILIISISYYGTILCYELTGIHFQLTGRSPEFKSLLTKKGDTERV